MPPEADQTPLSSPPPAAGSPPAGGNDPGGPSGGPSSIPIAAPPTGSPAAAASGGAPASQAGDLYKPNGIAPELVGKSNTETIDNLLKINKGFRDSQSKRGAVPEKPDGYAVGEIAPEIAKKLGKDMTKDPAIGALREVAHELGLSDKQFSGMVPKLLEKFDKMGLVPDASAFDPETQIAALEKDHMDIADPRARRVAAAKRIPEAKNKLDGLLAAKAIDKAEYDTLLSLLPQAKEFRLLEKIVGKFTATDGSVAIGAGGGPAGGLSEADILARRMDPRYDSRSPRHDAAFRAETDTLWQQLEARKRGAAA